MKTTLVIFIVLFIAFSARADILNVPQNYSSIQNAIDISQNGDTVLVDEGTYYENINFKGKAITVASHYILDQDTSYISTTIIDGSTHSDPDSGSVVYMISGEDTTSILTGFTITGGNGTASTINENGMTHDVRMGGGICITSGKGSRISWNIIENNIISSDDLVYGGGIVAGEPPLNAYYIIEHNSIRNNWVSGGFGYTQGGGIFFASNGRICNNTISGNIASGVNTIAVGGAIRLLSVEADFGARFCLIEENVIRDNQAVSENNDCFGGAVMSAGIRITLRNNDIISNTAKGHKEYSGGGGLYIGHLETGQHIIEGNLFLRNKLDGAYYGGGIALYNSTPLIINNIFYQNSGRYGGGLFQDNSSKAQVVNNTFYGNSASNQGGGIYSQSSTLNVMNTIVWNNTAPTGAQMYRTGGSEKIVYSDIQGGGTEDANINADPMFADTLFHLSDSSRCIGAGIASYNFSGTVFNAPEYDFDGNIRPHPADSHPDIGAMESERAYPLLPLIQIPNDYETIQAGIDAADDGDTVLVAEGTYYENVRIENKAITLASYFLIDEDTSHISKTIINGSHPVRPNDASVIMILDTPEPNTICGFTLTGGLGRKKTFQDGNFSQIGGGIDIEESSAIIKNNHIINNSVIGSAQALGVFGGGISLGAGVASGLTLKISGNLIAGNNISGMQTGGGGINISNYVMDGKLDYLIEENIIENNTIINMDEWKAMGGGIFLDFILPIKGMQIIRSNIISNNQAICDKSVSVKHHSFGGGMYILHRESTSSGSEDNDPGPYIQNNLIYGNHSDYLGGGVSVWRTFYFGGPAKPLTSEWKYVPKPSFINNTIVDNTALDGSGFYIMNHVPFLLNNILWNEYPENAVWGEIFLGDEPQWTEWVEGNKYGDVKINYTDIQGGWDDGVGNFDLNPLFSDTINYYLADESPCIDAGHVDSIFQDIVGYREIATWPAMGSARNDMGAYGGPYEYNYEDLTEITILTDVHKIISEIPKSFYLAQNYPNPFNPITVISWQLSVASNVDLSIYNILGQKVATLFSGKQPVGTYKIEWNAKEFASGVYLYRLATDKGFVETKKLILIK